MASKVLFVHIPVDRFTICNGPAAKQWTKHLITLHANRDAGRTNVAVEISFTVRTPASRQSFPRKMSLTHTDFEAMGSGKDCTEYPFQGTFSNQAVSGFYNPATRTGWFSAS